MRMTLSHPIPSIKEMDDFQLPNFAVVIGKNGVGKTRLLKAISAGSIEVLGVPPSGIEEYDITSFQPTDSGRGGWGHSTFFHLTVDRFLSSASGQSPADVAKGIYHDALESWELHDARKSILDFDESVRSIVRHIPDFTTLGKVEGKDAVSNYVNLICSEVLNNLESGGRNNQTTRTEQTGSFNNSPAALICQAMKLSGKLPHELSRRDILFASHYEGGTLTNQLSQIFSRYKAEQYALAHTESERCDKSVHQLLNEYFHDNIPPWRILRSNLDSLSVRPGTL